MRFSHIMLTSLALGLTTLPVLAQNDAPPPRGQGGAGAPGGPGGGRGGRGGGMPQASPEQLKAAYEAEATYVSTAAGLSADETSKVVMTYLDSRASQTKALEDMRAKLQEQMRQGGGSGEGEGGGADRRGKMQAEMQKAMDEVNKTEKAKLQGALNGFLKPEQTAKIIDTLGAYDRQWDVVTVAIVGLKLDADTQSKAMAASTEYSQAISKARDIEDPQARRDANSEARKKLNDEMKKVLSEEQFAQFQKAAGGGGRGQGAPGGEGAPRRRPPAGGEGGNAGG